MKITERERWLVMVLPTVLVVACYALWYQRSMRPALATLEQDYAAAVSGQLSPTAVAEQRRKADEPRRAIDQLQGKMKTLGSQAAAVCGPLGEPQRQIASNRALVDLFSRNGLSLVEETALQGEAATKLPKSLATALTRVGWSAQGSRGQVRSFKLNGSFGQVLKSIEELAEAEPCLAIPIGLSMAQADPNAGERQWTLIVWM
jgi:hypothetical protein